MSTKGKLIVLEAFNKNDDGELVPAFNPRRIDTEDQAERDARRLARSCAGVVAWSSEAGQVIEIGGRTGILYQHGEVPGLE